MKNYCVYEHVFPNGKKYIGITCDIGQRWREGRGYETQPKMNRAINKYGRENIEHNIIVDRLSKEQAEKLEKYLIAELKTFSDGYNATVGGDTVGGYYLDEYIMAMLRYAKRKYDKNQIYPIKFVDATIGMPELIEKGKKDKGFADFFNEASRAVTIKHGKYSTTKNDDVLDFFFHMREYFILSEKIHRGEDISNWKEKTVWEHNRDALEGVLRW